MIRVLQIIGNMNIGGMESMIMNYYRNIDRSRIHYDFLIFNKDTCFYENEINELGGNVFKITPRRINPIQNAIELKQFFLNNKYDIVEIHQGVTYLLPIKLAKKYGIKRIIVHSHGVDEKYKKGILNIYRKKYVIPYLNENANAFFACSKLIIDDLFDQERCKTKNYYLINNAVEMDKFVYNEKIREETRKKIGVCDDYVIGHVGRFHFQKNHEFIIELAKVLSDVKFLLIGDGEDIEKYKKVAPNNVIFYGSAPNVNEIMQTFDLFILPSRWEGLPVVGVEAQVNGLPCLMSNNITKETDITGNVTFLPLELEQWRKKILELKKVKRKDTKARIIDAGYDSKTEAVKLKNIYEEILRGEK